MGMADKLSSAIENLIQTSEPVDHGENTPLPAPPDNLVFNEGHTKLDAVSNEDLPKVLGEMPARRERALAELNMKEGDLVDLSKVNVLLSTLATEASFGGQGEILKRLSGLFTTVVEASREQVSGGLARDELRTNLLKDISEIGKISPFSPKDQ